MLELSNLNIAYGKHIILNNVDVQFGNGKITTITGESGCGKSSLLNVIGLLMKPNKDCKYTYKGKLINYNNQDTVSDIRLFDIGFIFQSNNLIQELTVLENVMVPVKMRTADNEKAKKEAIKWLKYVGIENLADSYPSDISGGEEQRVVIARALVNNADIILADEPTASLDSKNVDIIIDLFKKLAYDLNKIVIIVSHDKKVSGFGDVVYQIEDKQVIKVKDDNSASGVYSNKHSVNNKHIRGFIFWYDKLLKRPKKLTYFLIFITALITATSALFINFGESFTKEQKKFIDSISDRSMLIINDTLGINTDKNYDDAYSFDNKTIETINQIPNISKDYPFYEFCSFGITVNTSDTASIEIYNESNEIKKINYQNNFVSADEEFRVTPLYPEENIDYLLEYKSDKYAVDAGVVLTKKLADKIGIEKSELIDKTIKITCFVPIKMYLSETMISRDASQRTVNNEDKINIDGLICKKVTMEYKIAGILSCDYKNVKSDNKDCLILLNNSELMKIINDNKDNNIGMFEENFKEAPLSTSMLVVFADSVNSVETIKDKAQRVSPTITVVSRGLDIKTIENNINTIKDTMFIVCTIVIAIVVILFGIVFYYKNLSRKKEIGILKALGLTTHQVKLLVLYNMLKTSLATFVTSIILSLLLMLISTVLGISQFITLSIESFVLMFVLSFVIVIISGAISIRKTSKIDIIDAIRINK